MYHPTKMGPLMVVQLLYQELKALSNKVLDWLRWPQAFGQSLPLFNFLGDLSILLIIYRLREQMCPQSATFWFCSRKFLCIFTALAPKRWKKKDLNDLFILPFFSPSLFIFYAFLCFPTFVLRISLFFNILCCIFVFNALFFAFFFVFNVPFSASFFVFDALFSATLLFTPLFLHLSLLFYIFFQHLSAFLTSASVTVFSHKF